MAYDINTALERLEKNLSEVESAKKQVEETIATSESLQQTIGRYTEILNTTNKEISTFVDEVHNYQSIRTKDFNSAIAELKTSCECITNKFTADVKTTTNTFGNKLSETIVEFSSENEKLTGQIKKLILLQDVLYKATKEVNEVEKKVDVLANYLKISQDEQDETLISIKSALEVLPTSAKSYTDAVIENVNNHAKDLQANIDEISANVSLEIQNLNSIISELAKTQTMYNNIKTDMAIQKNTLDSNLKTIKTFIIVWTIIIGLILIVLRFI